MYSRQHFYTRIAKWVLIGCCLTVASSCKTYHPKYPLAGTRSQQTIEQSINIDKSLEKRKPTYAATPGNNIPYSVNNALLPSISSYVKSSQPTHQRFDVTASNIPAK